MKKADLLAAVNALPDDAEIRVVDMEFGGSDDFVIVRAGESSAYMFNHHGSPSENMFVITPEDN